MTDHSQCIDENEKQRIFLKIISSIDYLLNEKAANQKALNFYGKKMLNAGNRISREYFFNKRKSLLLFKKLYNACLKENKIVAQYAWKNIFMQDEPQIQEKALQLKQRLLASRKKKQKQKLKTLSLTGGGALAGAGVAGGVTSLLTDNRKARIISALLGAVGGGTGGYLLANHFNKKANLRKIASDEQIYKVAVLMKYANTKSQNHKSNQ